MSQDGIAISKFLKRLFYIPAPHSLQELDGWRAISVAAVVVCHVLISSSINIRYLHNWGYAVSLGTLGVQFFFVISGYVICRGLLRERSRDGEVSVGAFYKRRVFRIIPPLLLYTITVWILAQLGIVDHVASGVLRGLTFTCNWDRFQCGGHLGVHLWSLSTEEQFYLVIPFLLAMTGNRIVLSVIAYSVPVGVVALFALGQPRLAEYLVQFSAISMGVFCAANEHGIEKLLSRLPRWLPIGTIPMVLLIAALPPGRLTTIANALCLFPLVALVILGTSRRTSPLSGVLRNKAMQAIGISSYGIYLWQQLATYPFQNAGVLFYAISVSLCLVGSIVMFYVVESRLIALGRSLELGWNAVGSRQDEKG